MRDAQGPDTPLDSLLAGLLDPGAEVAAVGKWVLSAATARRDLGLKFTKGDLQFEVFIAPAAADTACHRATKRFKLGYRGALPDASAAAVLDTLFLRLREADRLLPEGAETVLFRQAEAESLEVSDGILELRVTERCNERCPFCNSIDWVVNRVTDAAAIRAAVEAAPGRGAGWVVFTGGEPSLAGELPEWTLLARRKGLKVRVETNGVLASSEGFWDSWRDEEGSRVLPDSLLVSFHTRHPERVGALTGVGGTFDRKVSCVRVARGLGIQVALNFVATALNLDELGDFPAWVAATFDREVSIVLSTVAPNGRAGARPDLIPRMDALGPALARAIDAARVAGIEIRVPEVCGVPMCVAPAHARDFQAWWRPVPVTSLAEDRTKPPACGRCIFDNRCIGVWRGYAERFGTDEFRPVAAPAEVVPSRGDAG